MDPIFDDEVGQGRPGTFLLIRCRPGLASHSKREDGHGHRGHEKRTLVWTVIPMTKAMTSLFLTWALACFATGCIHPKIGPNSLPRDRALYSTSLADSWKQQALLNIVKVRYVDPPVFVDVGSIVASYTLSQGATLEGTIEPSGSNSLTLGGSAVFSNTPTITYTPLTGSAYIKGLMTPLPPTLVFSGIQNGLPADSTLLSTVLSINGLRNQQATITGIAPADRDFHRVRELMRDIQLSGAVRMYVKEDANNRRSIVGLRTKDSTPEIQAASAELRRLLHLSPEATEFTLVNAPLPSSDTEIAVMTRSIIGILQNMAAEVEVPSEHLAQHRAPPGFEAGRKLPGLAPMIRIHSSKKKPDDAFVNVYYRNTWFWIDDGDLASKQALAQLLQLFTMADTGGKENLPVVTIPSR